MAQVVCAYHMDEDPDLPEWLKQELREMLEAGRSATAIQHVFYRVWDAGFEKRLPPEERNQLR